MTELLHSLLHALSPSDEAAEKKESRFKQFFVHFMTVKSKKQRKNVIAELGRHSLQNQKVWRRCASGDLVAELHCSNTHTHAQYTAPGEYDRDDLVVEMIEDAVSYAVSRGMQGWEVRVFLHLYCEVMDSICSKGIGGE